MPVKRCPECGRENDLDSLRCFRCGAALPAAGEPPPPGAEPEARSVVLATFDNHLSAQGAAKHLEDAGIPVVVNADDCGGLYPFLTPALGIRLLVKTSDLPRAREALSELREQFGIKTDGAGGDTGASVDAPKPPQKPAPHLVKLGFLLLGAVMGALSYYAWTVHQSLYTGTTDRDFNGDGRADAWWTYRQGELISYSLDRNFDGNPDYTDFYREGGAITAEADQNFDGKPDTWISYSNGVTTLTRFDMDFDGKVDSEMRWKFGRPVETRFAASNQLGYWRRDFWTNFVLRETWLDRNRDGTFEERHLFDAFGTFLRVEPFK